jgi:FHA domain
MPTCPAGHQSADTDYCETCGVRMPSAASGASAITSATTVFPAVPTSPPQECPECGDSLVDRFCEGCGFDTLHQQARRAQPPRPPVAGPPPGHTAPPRASGGPGAWTGQTGQTGSAGRWTGSGVDWLVVVAADRGYYERLMAESGSDPSSLPYPPYHPERQYPLTSQFLRIGRRSVGRGIRPDIDLSLPPEDPAVSHEHALLLSKPDGTWSLVDLGATNGTLLNDSPHPVSAHIEVPLHDGDRIYLGAWTVITLRKG